jgi:hypothetical protein
MSVPSMKDSVNELPGQGILRYFGLEDHFTRHPARGTVVFFRELPDCRKQSDP